MNMPLQHRFTASAVRWRTLLERRSSTISFRSFASCYRVVSRHVSSTSSSSSTSSTSASVSWSLSSPSASQPPSQEGARTLDGFPLNDVDCNVPLTVADKVGRNLHRRPLHPLNTIQRKIVEYWNDPQARISPLLNTSLGSDETLPLFPLWDHLSPIVSVQQNFDVLRIPADHVSRQKSDTYYLNSDTVLRTQTSAHQVQLLSSGLNRFLVSGDVYRRDEIDKSHYPVFHQLEGVCIFPPSAFASISPLNESSKLSQDQELILQDLKQGLEGMAKHLFGPETPMRWVDAYFPFTEPSLELEIFFQGAWLEVLGCGVIHPDILKAAGRPAEEKGWAFGLGLERLAMVLFDIPDIRLFWSEDERFHQQFQSGEIIKFQPYSKYPPCFKDLSFWLGDRNDHPVNEPFHVNDLNEMVRELAGDLVEQVQLIDEFTHPKSGRISHCYRISYRSMDRSLTNEEIDTLQDQVRQRAEQLLGVKLR